MTRTLPPIRYQGSHANFRAAVLERLSGARASAAKFGLARHRLFLQPAAIGLDFALLVSGRLHGAALVGAEALLIVLCLIGALGVAHDASHGALRASKRLNRLGVFVFDLVGVNGYVWHFDHVVAHHSTPNVSRYDANLYGWGPLRLDPHAPLRSWHRYQHLYAWLVYATASLFKVYLGDFLAIGRTRADAYLPPRHSARELLRLFGFKAWSIGFTLVLPWCTAGSPALVLTGYFIGHACNGLLMGAVFQPTHTNTRVAWPRPSNDGRMPTSFDAHVLATAADFAVDSGWITWLAGGLNIHAVHHLFPGIPQLELPEAAAAVRALAHEYGLEYLTFPTWRAALVSHYRALKALGARPGTSAEAAMAEGQ
jgi:linoleoyl-CoA desaturase